MSLTDLFTPNETLESVKDKVPVLGEPPKANYGYTLQTAWETPSALGQGLANKLMDSFESSKPLPLSKLNEMYPNNPNLFTEGMTARQAEYIYNKASKLSALNYAKDTRGTNFLGTLGYGIVEEANPVSLTVGAIGGVLAAGPVAAVVGSQILASAIVGGSLEAVSEYALRKSLEDYTKEEASITESVVTGLAGGALGEMAVLGAKRGVRAIFDDLGMAGKGSRFFSNMMDKAPKETVENVGRLLKEELAQRSSNIINGAQTTVLRSVNDLNMMDRIRYKAYASAGTNPDFEGSGAYMLFVKDSPASYNGPETSFGSGLYASNNPNVIKGYASSVRQGGELIKINVNDLKIFDGTTPLKKEDVKLFKKIFDTYDITIKENQSLSDIVDAIDNDKFEQSIQAILMENNFDSVALLHKGKILDLEYSNKGIYLFNEVNSYRRSTVDILEGNKGGIPQATELSNPITSKSYNLRHGTGILSNGKKIELDPEGYFATDPFYGSEQIAIGYTNLWSQNIIDEVDKAIGKGDVRYIKKKYEMVNKDVLDYLKQLEDYKIFEMGSNKPDPDMQLLTNLARTSSVELEAKLKELGVASKDSDTLIEFLQKAAEDEDMLVEIKAMQDELVARGESEAMGGKGKSVDKLAKEFKAEQVLEKANFESLTKEMVDRVTPRIGTSLERQNEQLIGIWKNTIEEIKANNPEIAEQIVKAAFHCLRKNT